jgi:hypothetical protein
VLIRSIIHYVFDILIFLSSLITICSCMINGCVSFCTRSALGSKYLEVAWVKTEPNWSLNNSTSVWSCVKARKQENVGVSSLKRENPLLNNNTSVWMCCYLIEDFPFSVMILLRFLVFLPLHRTTQMYCYLIEDFPVSVMIRLRFLARKRRSIITETGKSSIK